MLNWGAQCWTLQQNQWSDWVDYVSLFGPIVITCDSIENTRVGNTMYSSHAQFHSHQLRSVSGSTSYQDQEAHLTGNNEPQCPKKQIWDYCSLDSSTDHLFTSTVIPQQFTSHSLKVVCCFKVVSWGSNKSFSNLDWQSTLQPWVSAPPEDIYPT